MRSLDSFPRNPIAKALYEEFEDRYKRGVQTRSPELLMPFLTEKETTFVREYLKDLDLGRSIVAAGYSNKNPLQFGHQLLKSRKVGFVIELFLFERAKRSPLTKDEVIKKVLKIIDDCGQPGDEGYNPNVSLRGLEMLMRHMGMFIERTEITGKDGEAIKYEKAQEDARDFTSAISSLIERAKTDNIVSLKVVGGNEG